MMSEDCTALYRAAVTHGQAVAIMLHTAPTRQSTHDALLILRACRSCSRPSTCQPCTWPSRLCCHCTPQGARLVSCWTLVMVSPTQVSPWLKTAGYRPSCTDQGNIQDTTALHAWSGHKCSMDLQTA